MKARRPAASSASAQVVIAPTTSTNSRCVRSIAACPSSSVSVQASQSGSTIGFGRNEPALHNMHRAFARGVERALEEAPLVMDGATG